MNNEFSDWNLIELVTLTFKRHLLNVEENIALDRELKKRSEAHTNEAKHLLKWQLLVLNK